MSLFASPEEHAANPPETWTMEHARYPASGQPVPRLWRLQTQDGSVLETFKTKRAAEAARTDSFVARVYATEARWYAGEPVLGWRPYAAIAAERAARESAR